MNWEAVIAQVQDIRAQLEAWGITYQVLIAIGVLAGVTFLLSVRNILLWTFKVDEMRSELKTLRLQAIQLQESLDRLSDQLEKEEPPKKAALDRKFNLDH